MIEKIALICSIILMTIVVFYIAEAITLPQLRDKDCVSYKGSNLIIMDNSNGVCNWLVNKLLGNGSGYHLIHYNPGPFKLTEKFVLTR